MFIKSLTILMVFLSVSTFAQQDGYWDKERATNKQVVLGARNRILISSVELPVGTTELVFRMTLLDENQQLANSLASVLKAIPDPTGISQGSAGALFLMSKISGEDKCKYAVFSNEAVAKEYIISGKTENACYVQDVPLNKDAKRLSINKSTCLKANTLWFGFENKNWIMNQRIVLEIVPWVDNKLSRAWSLENRKAIIKLCKSTDLAKRIPNSDDYCVCVLDKIQKEYRFQEYQNLLAVEKIKVFKDFGASCLNETGGSKAIYASLRNEATNLYSQGKYGPAIDKTLEIVNEGKANVSDYNRLGRAYIFTKQYGKAIRFLKIGEQLDESELETKLNLAHAYLLNNNYKPAKTIYKTYQNQNINDSLGWVEKVKLDFEAFEKAGLNTNDFGAIIRVFKN